MSCIGSLVFCPDCGDLLDGAAGDEKAVLTCTICGAQCKDTSSKVIVTQSKPTDFPSSLRVKRSDIQMVDSGLDANPTIMHPCENCGAEEVRFYTQQLRGADEGTTVFYECPQCRHKWNTNN
ncbi:hypothetical protein EJ06DRAFT_231748 [Trichodelitschia bisporula]|uniref:DNA-directed RNA polymerase subunit n=1 Tax=Trichodelitschia bisporula TaxID=703511 RepID=A0A6G1HKZ0_9PEZI|nr:hypothetical protein EJ06DRAFT_231748 [Trichodelitschia bisporula]